MSLDLKTLQQFWKSCIASNKPHELFSSLEEELSPFTTNYNHFVQLKARHNKWYTNDMNGILTVEDSKVIYQQIQFDSIRFVDSLEPQDLQNKSSIGSDVLDTFARALGIQIPLTPLYLVNCNRDIELRTFRRRFGQWEEQNLPFQFYYILACPTQEPEGFSERIVYELMGDFEDSQHQNLNCRRCEGSERLRIEPLPLSRISVQNCKEAFKKYFAGRFSLGNTSFEDYLRIVLPDLKWEYIITVFKITSGQWDAELMEDYLKWLMDSFSSTNTQKPKFLFFFVISLKNAHQQDRIQSKDREALESVQRLVERNNDRATLIAALPPVPVLDFEDWLEMVSSANETQKNEIIDAISQRLNNEEKSNFEHADRLLNMERIEDFQERVYKYHS